MARHNALTEKLKSASSLPLLVAPLFLNTTPDLVLACAREGVISAIPAYGQLTSAGWDDWLTEIDRGVERLKSENTDAKIGLYAANLIFKANNDRLDDDLAIVIKHKVPLVFASAEPTKEQIAQIHAYGGIVLHDVASAAEAKKALGNGADGLIAITAGAGGQGSTQNPVALVNEIRQFFDGPLALAGCLSTGRDIMAAQAIGADFADMGTRFVATTEARADGAYKQMIAHAKQDDIVYTTAFTAQPANFLRDSIKAAGFDADKIATEGTAAARIKPPPGEKSKSWKFVWAAGQGSGSVHDVLPAAELITRLKREYAEARAEFIEEIAAPAEKTAANTNAAAAKTLRPGR